MVVSAGRFKRDRTTGKITATDPQFTFPSGCVENNSSQDLCFYGIGPYDFATIYNVQPLWNAGINGTGQTIAIVGEGNFFGEGSLAGQLLRMGSAAAMTDCEILRVDKKTMIDALHREPTFSEMFVAYLLARNIRYEEDLVDQLFNSSEKRLARVLTIAGSFR